MYYALRVVREDGVVGVHGHCHDYKVNRVKKLKKKLKKYFYNHDSGEYRYLKITDNSHVINPHKIFLVHDVLISEISEEQYDYYKTHAFIDHGTKVKVVKARLGKKTTLENVIKTLIETQGITNPDELTSKRQYINDLVLSNKIPCLYVEPCVYVETCLLLKFNMLDGYDAILASDDKVVLWHSERKMKIILEKIPNTKNYKKSDAVVLPPDSDLVRAIKHHVRKMSGYVINNNLNKECYCVVY